MALDQELNPVIAQDFHALYELYHDTTYYTPEIGVFKERGMGGYWMAYFAFRAAPLGPVPAEVVIATFYNFAPRMIERAIPAAWSVMSPEEILATRLAAVDSALRRILRDRVDSPSLAEAAPLAREAIEGCDLAGRPLYAAYAALSWPAEPHLTLWHACTLLREHRFDGHNIALAAADVNGVASHVLMVARGHGTRASILPRRGWTEEEWDAAERLLIDRGWLNPDGAFTEQGLAARREIEDRTNRLALEPVRRLGPAGTRRLMDLMAPFVQVVREEGGVPGQWPPPQPLRPNG